MADLLYDPSMGAVIANGIRAVRLVRPSWLRVPRWLTVASVRAHVVGLILVIVTPLLMFSAFLVLRSALNEQELMGRTVRERAREAAANLDHQLGTLRSRLFLLAASHHLRAGDFERFHAHAADAVRADDLGVVLSDLTGTQILNTRVSFGEPLPSGPGFNLAEGVVAGGQPDVSDLLRSPLTGDSFIALNVPVLRGGQLAYVLSLDIAPLVPLLLADLRLPQDWIVTLSDRAGYTIARSREADRFVGQLGRPAVLERFRAADEGWFPLTSRDGIPVYNAFAHVRFSGWTLAVAIPDKILYAPVRRSTGALILACGASLALALLLGVIIGRRLSGAITGLAGYADAVGRGEQIGLLSTGIQETDAVARSLHLASEQLRHGAQQRAVLLDRTVTAQEAERRRIARELHDSLGQYLTALRLGFAAIEPLSATNPQARERLAEVKNLATNLGRELNRIAWELRPMALDDLGLERAIVQYLEEWADRSRLHIDLEINLGDRRLPQAVETALFRVLQEAITNVMKHAGANRVGVIVAATENELRLIVEDDGKGFDLEAGDQDLSLRHLGLLGARERLALVGGSLDVESSALNGTTLYARIGL